MVLNRRLYKAQQFLEYSRALPLTFVPAASAFLVKYSAFLVSGQETHEASQFRAAVRHCWMTGAETKLYGQLPVISKVRPFPASPASVDQQASKIPVLAHRRYHQQYHGTVI